MQSSLVLKDAATTTIVASPTSLVADGSTQSTITVQAKDHGIGNNHDGEWRSRHP